MFKPRLNTNKQGKPGKPSSNPNADLVPIQKKKPKRRKPKQKVNLICY